MYRLRAFTAAAIILGLLYACSPPRQPAKTNVLGTPSHTPENAQGNRRMSAAEMHNYHKNKPQPNSPKEQKIVENNKKAIQKEPNPVPVIVKVNELIKQISDTITSASFAYRSPEYYRFITDSIQQAEAKPAYYRIADSLMRLMTKLPSNTKNPAIDTSQWYTTVNFNIRKPNYIVLHHTAQNSADQTLYTFTVPRTAVSAHYVVGRDGIIYQMLNDYMKAWHAGIGRWGSINDMNSCSLGIEIDNNGSEPFSDAQIGSLIKLLTYLKREYQIPQENFIAHSDYAPVRKNDPSRYFPWEKLANAGFGYWYDTLNLKEPPPDFNALMALRVIGYDIRNIEAAVKAFKLHYIQSDVSTSLTDYDKKVLYNLYQKF